MNHIFLILILLLPLSSFFQSCLAEDVMPSATQILPADQSNNPLNLVPEPTTSNPSSFDPSSGSGLRMSEGSAQPQVLDERSKNISVAHPEERGTSVLKGLPDDQDPLALSLSKGRSSQGKDGSTPPLPPTSTAPLSLTLNAKDSKEKTKEKANVYLNFENSSLASILNYLAEEKKLNILPNKELENVKVSLSTRNPLTLERAWNVLLTLLEMNNFSIIKVGNLHRVITNKENGQHPLPTYTSKSGTNPEDLPESDLIIRYVYFFNNIKPDVAKDILGSMLEGDQSVQISQDLQACIIKEKCFNIKAAMQIIKELDTGGLRESIKIYQLQETNVDIVHNIFKEILGEKDKTIRFSLPEMKKDSSYFSSDTQIIQYPAKNSLILLGTEKNLNKIIEFIKQHLDVPIGSAKSRIHIKEVRYAKAESLKPIIENSIKPPSGQATDKSILVGKYKFFDDVIISAEEGGGSENSRGGGNRLIIAANNEDWKRISAFIDQLDKPQPQVAFEIIVIDVEESQDKKLGAQIQNKEGKDLGMGMQAASFNNIHSGADIENDAQKDSNSNDAATDTTNKPASKEVPTLKYAQIVEKLGAGNPSFLTLGRASDTNPAESDIWAIIRATFSTNNTHIVTQPYLIANNYQQCSITVNETRRVRGPLQNTKGEPDKTTFKYNDAGTVVNLTPQINSDGVVNLDIDIKIDEFQDAINANTDPSTLKRSIKTKASMLTGEVLVLGGLKKSNMEVNTYKTPLLGDIPILGTFFRNTSKIKSTSNLYVFIRPSIIKPRFEGAPDEYTQLKIDYAKYQLLGTDKIMRSNDPIQRWYFKPRKTSLSDKVTKARDGRFEPIDNFALGKFQPHSVNIKEDPYFKVSEAIAQTKKAKQLKQRNQTV